MSALGRARAEDNLVPFIRRRMGVNQKSRPVKSGQPGRFQRRVGHGPPSESVVRLGIAHSYS